MPDIGAKITLEGERAYREALKEITNGQKVMRAELELVTAKFEGQGDAIDALAEKKDVLERTLNGERDRIDLLSQALENAASQFGEADTRTMKYQEQLYAAQAAAAKLETQIGMLNGQMADREKADRFSDAIRQQADAIDGAAQKQEMLESELKKLDAQYDATGNKSEILREKQRNLTEQIENQQTKIDALREVLEKASETYGENSDEVRRWQKELDSAEGELAEMQGALDDTTDKAGDGQGGLGHAIVQLADKFGITLPEGMKATLESFGQFDAGTALVIGGAGAIASAIIAAEKAMIGITKEAAFRADDLNTLSAKTGISTEVLQEYEFMAEKIDTSVDTIAKANARLVMNMNTARNATKDTNAVMAFRELGIEYADAEGELRDSREVFGEVIDALREMDNETERDAAAMALFGRSAQELNPMIKAGSERMRELAQAAHDTGYVLSEEELGSLNGLSDAFDSFDKLIDTTKNKLALEFTPTMTDSLGKLQTFATDLSKALQDSGIVDVLATILEDVTGIVKPAKELGDDVLPKINTTLRPVAYALAVIRDSVRTIGSMLNVVKLFSEGPQAYFQGIGQASGIWGLMDEKYFNATQQLVADWKAADAEVEKQREEIQKKINDYYENGPTVATWEEMAEEMGLGLAAPIYKRPIDTADRTGREVEIIDIPLLDGQNAIGAHNWRGGFTRVGENGPENVWLPRGSRIETAQASRGNGDTYITVTIDAKNVREFNDVIAAAERARMQLRKAAG